MCALCRVEEGTVGLSSLSGISKRTPCRFESLVTLGIFIFLFVRRGAPVPWHNGQSSLQ